MKDFHNHPKKEQELGLSPKHVILDRCFYDWGLGQWRYVKATAKDRVFIYVEHQDGGMEVHTITSPDVLRNILYGWMTPDCVKQDIALLEWMAIASMGDYTEHRLGLIFCVRPLFNKAGG